MKYQAPFGSVDPDAPYVDRNTPNAIQGSKVPAKAIEHPQREIVEVIERAGLTPSEGSVTQLWEALQQLLKSFPIYPESLNSNGTFDLTSPSPGTIRVPAGVQFVMRGAELRTTEQTDLTTLSSKTYHVRWDKVNGFRILDLASVGYNPTSAAETSVAFDSDYDDVLVARVVTNGSNVATITNLVNKAKLATEVSKSLALADARTPATLTGSGAAINWARKPQFGQPLLQGARSFNTAMDGTTHGPGAGIWRAFAIKNAAGGVTRYGAPDLTYYYEDDTTNDGYVEFVWAFIA